MGGKRRGRNWGGRRCWAVIRVARRVGGMGFSGDVSLGREMDGEDGGRMAWGFWGGRRNLWEEVVETRL